MPGHDDRITIQKKLTYTYRKPKIDPEKIRIFILSVIAILSIIIIATSALNILLGFPFNAVEAVFDFSIFIFAAALLGVNFSPSRASRSLGFKRIAYSMGLLLGLFAIPDSIETALYFSGYTFALMPPIIAADIIAVFTVDFFITTSWYWNRRFVDFRTMSPLRVSLANAENATFERAKGFSSRDEEIARKYIAGRMSTEQFLSALGDTPESRKLLSMADSAIEQAKKNYRW